MISAVALPAVRRARDFHLYTEDGRRLLDLFLDGGGALLGHRPDRLGRELKTVLARGLAGNLPSNYEARLVRALRRVLPGHGWFGIAPTTADAWRLLGERLADAPSLANVPDPLYDRDWCSAEVAWWRPLCDEQPPEGAWLGGGPKALLHRLPFRVGAGPVTVSTREPVGGAVKPHIAGSVSPLLLSGAAVAVRHLARSAPERLAVAAHWPREIGAWRRSGIYLFANYPRNQHANVHAAFLTAGVLLNPDYPGPNILPGNANQGEWRLLKRLFATRPAT